MRNQFWNPKALITWAVVNYAHNPADNSQQKANKFIGMLKS
jgi:hypothetical protein